MKSVAILHAYSAKNRGDGLLVDQALRLVREAVGECDFTIAASDPESFNYTGARLLCSKPGRAGYERDYLAFLRRLDSYDLVVGVGGGYLRAGYLLESVKMGLVMGPQLVAASRRSGNTVYLPQSVGPLARLVRCGVRRAMRNFDTVYVRDDLSVSELNLPNVVRAPDMAALEISREGVVGEIPAQRPVVSIRAVRGEVPPEVYRLASILGAYDVYVQSTVSGNDDRPATATLTPTDEVDASKLFGSGGPTRVVVAVRLHAALMALEAGHYVVHLAYERKGFGAFSDLGLGEFVHRYRGFDPDSVARQVSSLLTSSAARERYDLRIGGTLSKRSDARDEIIGTLGR